MNVVIEREAITALKLSGRLRNYLLKKSNSQNLALHVLIAMIRYLPLNYSEIKRLMRSKHAMLALLINKETKIVMNLLFTSYMLFVISLL